MVIVRIVATTDRFHAIEAVKKLRAATGMTLEDGLSLVDRIAANEKVRIDVLSHAAAMTLQGELEVCGVLAEIGPTKV